MERKQGNQSEREKEGKLHECTKTERDTGGERQLQGEVDVEEEKGEKKERRSSERVYKRMGIQVKYTKQ